MNHIPLGRWRPLGRITTFKLAEGSIIAVDFNGLRHKPWRIEEIRRRDKRTILTLRPPGPEFDLAQFNQIISYPTPHSARPGIESAPFGIVVLDEPYPVCSHCGELMPCTEEWVETLVARDIEKTARYQNPAICPACEEPITTRQKTVTFDTNLYVPLGPPVTYHLRQKCLYKAITYEKEVAKATGIDPRLSCSGYLTLHCLLPDQCTNPTCPGPDARHRGWDAICRSRGMCPQCINLPPEHPTTYHAPGE